MAPELSSSGRPGKADVIEPHQADDVAKEIIYEESAEQIYVGCGRGLAPCDRDGDKGAEKKDTDADVLPTWLAFPPVSIKGEAKESDSLWEPQPEIGEPEEGEGIEEPGENEEKGAVVVTHLSGMEEKP